MRCELEITDDGMKALIEKPGDAEAEKLVFEKLKLPDNTYHVSHSLTW